MSNRSLVRVFGALLIAGFVGTALAGEVSTLGTLEIDTSWARASIGTARPGAAYVTIRNTGAHMERLIGVSTPAGAHPNVHEMTEEDGVIRMRPAGPLEIPPGEEVHLEPAGAHIMLMQLRQPLEEGDQVPLTLVFENAGEITVAAPIGGIGAREPPE